MVATRVAIGAATGSRQGTEATALRNYNTTLCPLCTGGRGRRIGKYGKALHRPRRGRGGAATKPMLRATELC